MHRYSHSETYQVGDYLVRCRVTGRSDIGRYNCSRSFDECESGAVANYPFKPINQYGAVGVFAHRLRATDRRGARSLRALHTCIYCTTSQRCRRARRVSCILSTHWLLLASPKILEENGRRNWPSFALQNACNDQYCSVVYPLREDHTDHIPYRVTTPQDTIDYRPHADSLQPLHKWRLLWLNSISIIPRFLT